MSPGNDVVCTGCGVLEIVLKKERLSKRCAYCGRFEICIMGTASLLQTDCCLFNITSSTAQGGGRSFKNRKQLQLHYATLQLQLQRHYTTLHPAVVGQVTTATIATTPKNTTSTTFRSISGFALPSVIHSVV